MSWRLAPALNTLRGQVNALYPLRDKRSDGSIGDAAHASRKSDHNPNARGVVCAIDLDEDIAPGLDLEGFLAELRRAKDPRAYYVIYEGFIYGRWTGFAPEKYTGPNAHLHHLHISVNQNADLYEDDATWDLGEFGAKKPVAAPITVRPPANTVKISGTPVTTLKLGSSGAKVGAVQRWLRGTFPAYRWSSRVYRGFLLPVDNKYGSHTKEWVRVFQKKTGLFQDGVFGPKTEAMARRHGYKG